MITKQEFVEETRKWLGTKWRHQGRNSKGVDCVGLVIVVAKDLGLIGADYENTTYSRRALGYNFVKEFTDVKELGNVPLNKVGDADIVIFSDGVYPCHCGIVTTKWGTQHFIHAHALQSEVMEEAYPWRKSGVLVNRIVAFRFSGVE